MIMIVLVMLLMRHAFSVLFRTVESEQDETADEDHRHGDEDHVFSH